MDNPLSIKEYVSLRKKELAEQAASFSKAPTLLIIQANDDPASNSYVRGKIKDGQEVGFKVDLLKFPTDVAEQDTLGNRRPAD